MIEICLINEFGERRCGCSWCEKYMRGPVSLAEHEACEKLLHDAMNPTLWQRLRGWITKEQDIERTR